MKAASDEKDHPQVPVRDNSVDFSQHEDKFGEDSGAGCWRSRPSDNTSPHKSSIATMQLSNSNPTFTDSYDSLATPTTDRAFLLPPGADTHRDVLAAKEFYSVPHLVGDSHACISFSQTSPSSSKKEDFESETSSSLVGQLPILLQEQYLSLAPSKQLEADTIFRGIFERSRTDPTLWFQSFLDDHKKSFSTHSPTASYHALDLGPSLDRYSVTPLSDEGSAEKIAFDTIAPPGFQDPHHQFSFADLPQGYLRGIEDTLLDTDFPEEKTTSIPENPPEFTLLPTHQSMFDALTPKEQVDVVEFFKEGTLTEESIRNPCAFYSKIFTKYLRAKVPPFELPKKCATSFEQLPRAQQEEAQAYCEKAAKRIVANGRSIRNPSSYYSKVFQSFCEDHTEQPTQDTSTSVSSGLVEPEFTLPKNRRKAFHSLPDQEQHFARKFCVDAARSVIAAGHSIRNPAAYYGKVLDSIQDNLTNMVAGTNNADDSSQTSGSGVPPFALQASTTRMFQAMSREMQAKATSFCVQQAQSEIDSGKRIRNPAAFYSVSFQKFRHRACKDDSPTSADHVPEFALGDEQRKRLEQLPESSRDEVVKFCVDAARTVLETGRTIRSPKAFYNKNLDRFLQSQQSPQPLETDDIPEFRLPESQRRVFDALSSSQRDTALNYCINSAKAAILDDETKIEDPKAFYGWAFHSFFEDQTSLSSPPDILKEAPGMTTSPQKSPGPRSARIMESSPLSADILQRDLSDTKSMLDTKTRACEQLSGLLKQEQESSKQAQREASSLREKLAEQEGLIADLQREKSGLQARSKLLSQLEQRSKADSLTIASLKDELKSAQDKYNSESQTYRKMTSTFASISDELCQERQRFRVCEQELLALQNKTQ